ncbi:hypothetical protein LWI29_012759 [Acer saccharum]|uniref:Uncharacterized protein n=1 Tax=Acer saccharum TaxID=4024 RepID=A0AA39RJT5_ACESA|nr:hypothetical protein LWI29_012759 [Acer saccharum]
MFCRNIRLRREELGKAKNGCSMRRSEKSKKPCKRENRFPPNSGTRRQRFTKKSILKTKTLLILKTRRSVFC